MDCRCYTQIVCFSKAPSRALIAASPRAREAVEHAQSWYVCGRLKTKLQSGTHFSSSHTLERCIIFDAYSDNGGVPPYYWWLQHHCNKNTPLALTLPAFVELREGDGDVGGGGHSILLGCCGAYAVRLSSEALENAYTAQLDDMALYVRLTSLRSLTLFNSVCDFKCLRVCHGLEALHIDNDCGVEKQKDYSGIAEVPHLRVLTMKRIWVISLAWLKGCTSLRQLSLEDLPDYTNGFEAIGELRELRSLTLHHYYVGEGDLRWLTGCQRLQKLSLSCVKSVLSFMKDLPGLRCASIRWIIPSFILQPPRTSGSDDNLHVTKPLGLVQIELISEEAKHIEWISHCHILKDLRLAHCVAMKDLSPVGRLPSLLKLALFQLKVEHLEWLPGCASLVELRLTNCTRIKDYTPINDLQQLQVLCIKNGSDQAKWLPSCPYLEHLEASYDVNIDVESLGRLQHLRTLLLHWQGKGGDRSDTTGISLESTSQCTRLEEVNLCGGLGYLVDIAPLGKLQCLRRLDVSRMGITSIACLARCPLLEELRLRWVAIGDLQRMKNFPSLRSVFLGNMHHPLTQEKKIEKIISSLPHIKFIIKDK